MAPRTLLWKTLLPALLLALVAGMASGQGIDDLIGIYTADDGTGVSHLTTQVGPQYPVSVYLCVTGCTDLSGIAGWECTLSGMESANGVIVTQWDLVWGVGASYPPLNIGTPPDFIVGIGTYLAHSPCIPLVKLSFFVTDPNPKYFYIHQCPWPSIPGHPVYAGGNNPGHLVAMDWASGGEAHPAFVVNGFTDALNVENHVMSHGEGGTVNFVLNAGPGYKGRNYFLMGSLGQAGIPLPGGASLPLTWDKVAQFIYAHHNNSMLTRFRGRLTSEGRGRAVLSKPGSFPLPVGMTMHFAYTTEAPYDFQSNVVDIDIVP